MALLIILPDLADAMRHYCTVEHKGNVPANLNSVVSYSFKTKRHLTVRMIGQIRISGSLTGTGTVVIENGNCVYIYTGSWSEDGTMEVQSINSDFFSFSGIKYTDKDQDISFEAEVDTDGTVNSVDDTHVCVKGTKVEFPLVPLHGMRMLGPDGDYILINEDLCMTTEEMNEKTLFNEGGVRVCRITRDFVVYKNSTTIYGQLDMWKTDKTIHWYNSPTTFEHDDEVVASRFNDWLNDPTAPRNLLRALGIRIPTVPERVHEVVEKDSLPEVASAALAS